jgi:TPR repeat protein
VVYENGDGVTKDLKTAVEFYRKSAKRGWTSAKQALGKRSQPPSFLRDRGRSSM